MDSFVPLIVVKQTVLLRLSHSWIGLDRLWASDPWLIFAGVEDFIDQEL